MKITYEHEGEEFELTCDASAREWKGGHPGIATSLTHAFVATLGQAEYYPTAWHRAKHVADFLQGTLDTPQPAFETGEKDDVIY